jgi:uncharacterized protein (UPF0333 family)
MVKPFQDQRGQASLEYLLVGLLLVALIVGIAAIAKAVRSGTFNEQAAASASHVMTTEKAGAAGDVLLF